MKTKNCPNQISTKDWTTSPPMPKSVKAFALLLIFLYGVKLITHILGGLMLLASNPQNILDRWGFVAFYGGIELAHFVTACFLLKRKKWAWGLIIILSLYGALQGIASYLTGKSSLAITSAYSIGHMFVVWYFLMPMTRSVFNGTNEVHDQNKNSKSPVFTVKSDVCARIFWVLRHWIFYCFVAICIKHLSFMQEQNIFSYFFVVGAICFFALGPFLILSIFFGLILQLIKASIRVRLIATMIVIGLFLIVMAKLFEPIEAYGIGLGKHMYSVRNVLGTAEGDTHQG